jgi:hypothetical protein
MNFSSFKAMRHTRGAALVEYVVLLAGLVIVLPALYVFGEKIPELFEDPPGLEIPTTTPTLVVEIPGCVETGQCEPPPEVIEYCIENTASGVMCDIVDVVVIKDPTAGDFVVAATPSDPKIEFSVSDKNEDYPEPVYANSFSASIANQEDIMSHTAFYSHPGGEFCAGRGGVLPSMAALQAMAPHMDILNIAPATYLSSSQYWAVGDYNPPPVLVPGNYVSLFEFRDYERGLNPIGHGFVRHPFYVRCIHTGR